MKRISVDPRLPATVLFLCFLNPPRTLLLFGAAAAWHEAGHLLAARILRLRLERLRFGAAGVTFSFSPALQSYKKDAFLALSGPAANLLLCGALIPVLRASPREEFFFLFFSSLHLALFNLLPAPTLDGGRALYALLARRASIDRAEKTLRLTGRISSTILFFAGGAALIFAGDPFLLFAAVLLAFGA